MSRLSNTNRLLHPKCPTTIWDEHNKKYKSVGPHTLLNLGYYAGCLKGDFGKESSWESFSEEMLNYCVQDVKVNRKIYERLNKELNGFSELSINLEMDVAKHIRQQEINGWVFDIKKALELNAELEEIKKELEEEVWKTFKPLPKIIKEIQPRKTKNGEINSVGLKFLGEYFEKIIPIPEYVEGKYGIEYISGSFTRIDWPEFNLGSRKQIAEQLIHRGWKPEVFTPVTDNGGGGNIVVNELVLDSIRGEFREATLLADYFMITKRQAMLDNWISNYNEDTGRIHGYVNTVGAVTGRMTHNNPNLAQVPATKVDKDNHPIFGFEGSFGADCRSLFTVPKGYKQVGCDASGLELRCLAHYMNDDKYTDTILNGDIHTENQIAAGLPNRNNAKTFIYAFLYGAGDSKIGKIISGGAKEGKKLKEKFLKNTPSLKVLRENVNLAAERGWLKGIDGRKVRVRSQHAALNTLLQSAGAIAMKVWLDILIKEATKLRLDFKAVGNIHDEGQFEVKEKDVNKFTEIALNSMVKAGEFLNFRCPLAGEVKVGNTWCDTH